MMITIREVSTRKDLKQFIRLPWSIYKGDPYWVPPLLMEEKELYDPARHPFFGHGEVRLYLAERAGEVVGRIAGIINHAHNEFHKDRVGFFGCFEAVEEPGVARALFDTVKDFLRSRQMNTMRGPMNYSTNEVCALLVDGFDSSPCIMMPYNPRYYIDLLEGYGFRKAKDLVAYHLARENFDPRVRKLAERIRERTSFVVRHIDIKKINEEIERIKQVYNYAWEKNWGFVPMRDEEFSYLAKKIKQIADARFCVVVEHRGRPVAFMLNLPDYNMLFKKMNGRFFPFGIFIFLLGRKKIPHVRTLTLGVVKEFRGAGIEVLLYTTLLDFSYKTGITEAEMSWILEDNTLMRKGLEDLNCKVYKTYRIYDYPLA